MKKEEKLMTAQKCLSFIDESVTCYQAVEVMERELLKSGFQRLKERDEWKLSKGGCYYVKRNESAIMAFRIPEKEMKGFHVIASHSDSPTFKLKINPELIVSDKYLRLNTECYGGMLYSTWFDRSLSIAGRVVYEGKEGLTSVNVNVDEDLLVIPSLAIHMNREANKGIAFNPQTELLPFMGSSSHKEYLSKRLSHLAGVKKEEILGSDLFLYVREKGKLAGAERELMMSPRLDDLECVYASLEALLTMKPESYGTVCAVFNNEEVGSLTRQGASSTFLKDTLMRIAEGLEKTGSSYLRLLSESFMISADNAHALHPNYTEKADASGKPVINGGIVIKHHGGQKYTTDAYTEGAMKLLCKEACVPFQDYHNRSDIPGGSTLGNLAMAQVAIPTVDIGLPQLAMHAAVETAGSLDIWYLLEVFKTFYHK